MKKSLHKRKYDKILTNFGQSERIKKAEANETIRLLIFNEASFHLIHSKKECVIIKVHFIHLASISRQN